MNTSFNHTIQASFVLALSIGLCCVLAGCSSSPCAGDGERAVQDHIKQDSEGRIRLIKFQKTNGSRRELGGFKSLEGLKTYAMELNAEIEFTENCTWMTGIMGSQLSFNTAPGNFMMGTPVTKGHRVRLSGVVGFLKNGNGWSVGGVDLSQIVSEEDSNRTQAPAIHASSSFQSPAASSSSSAQSVAAVPTSGLVQPPANSALEANGPSVQKSSEGSTKPPQELREKAVKGDPEAQYELGKMYSDGQDIAKDAVEAVKWFQRSADQGFAAGQNALGTMYAGLGIKEDKVEAVRLYRLAAAQGNANAEANLGWAYVFGEGVAQDRSEAVRWFKKAADKGFDRGQAGLAEMYHKGWGIEQDKAEAVKLYRKAADQGNTWAQFQLGTMYMTGEEVPLDEEVGAEWYQKAAKGGNKTAIELLGKMGLGIDSPIHEKMASRACVSHLMQIGLAFRIWANEHDDQFPFNVEAKSGGTKESCGHVHDGFDANAVLHFLVISNELGTPKILVCPSDSTKHPATDFPGLLAANVTYQVRSGTDLNEGTSDEILARCPIHGHLLYCNGGVKRMDKNK